MDNNLEEKIDLIKQLNTDDSNFIINVYEAYQKHQKDLEIRIRSTSIILKSNFTKSFPIIVDLDKIWVKPYLYTKMRLHLDEIIEKIANTSISQISQKTSRFCKKIIYHNSTKKFEKAEGEIDIVDFIQVLNQKKSENSSYNTDLIFIAKQIDEETLFKEEQIKKAIEIINTDSKEKKYERIYNEIYSYLKKDFVANHYCDFKNNKCIAQRRFSFYPFNKKNGCCFKQIKTCHHLQKGGSCNVECMACRLFSCDYLTKRGIAYYASEFVLFKAFLNKKQRKHLVFDFYKPKSEVLKNIYKNS